MKRRKNNIGYTILLLLILVIGIGYAYLTSNLSITGSTAVIGNTWDIHFANVQVSTGSVTATTPATINPSDNTKINYTVLLNRPGDYYEFTVDVVNSGTLPGVISLTTLSGLNEAYSNIVDYNVNYTNGNPVQVDDILNDGETKTIKVRTFFKEDIANEDLPADSINLNLEYNVKYIQSEIRESTTGNLLQNLAADNTCITKYEGQITDRLRVTENATNVYFDKCADKRNVIFGGFCWQVIRSTETNGLKMIYNGEPVNGKCEGNRGTHKGIVQTNDDNSQEINTSYLYGSSFTYNTSNNTFTLVDTTTATWSNITAEDLIGKYTCKSLSDTCTTIYNINGYIDDITAFTTSYRIDNTNYAEIGTSSFNANSISPAMVGYMFNKVYNFNYITPEQTTYKFGSTFTYNSGTNTYTLSGTVHNINTWSSEYNTINNTHYTCWNSTGTCSEISYVNFSSSSEAYYYNMTNGKGVNDILDEMLWNNEVNTHNSSIKGIVDNWYAQNLRTKTNKLEDTVYCNARNVDSLGSWNSDGGNTTSNYHIRFKNYAVTDDMTCPNERDQFTVGNNKAKLTYPVGLLQDEESSNINDISLTNTGTSWWGFSPDCLTATSAVIRGTDNNGDFYFYSVNEAHGTRPVISLASFNVITSGTGSETDPWIIKE